MQCHCGLAGGFCGGASSLLRRGSISQYGHAGDWATRLVYIFSGLVFFGGGLSFPGRTPVPIVPRSRALITVTYDFPEQPPRAVFSLHPIFLRPAMRAISPVKHRPEMEMRLAALTSPRRPPPPLPLLSLAIYGSHFLPSRS